MIEYTKLGEILPFITNPVTTKLAKNKRPSPILWSVLQVADIDPTDVTGVSTFLNSEENDLKIFIIYGTNPTCAMMHEVVSGVHYFIIFADYLIDETDFDKLCEMCKSVVAIIAYYVLPDQCEKSQYVKDIYSDNLVDRISSIALYNVWVALNHPIEFKDEVRAKMVELDEALGVKNYMD